MWDDRQGSRTEARYSSPSLAVENELMASRRISAASDDSFDASSYVHVDSKLDRKLPKSLLASDSHEKTLCNHFSKPTSSPKNHTTTKSGKRIIRKRLSMSEFNASRAKANMNNNCNATSSHFKSKNREFRNSSSSDNDSAPGTHKRSTEILSAKIQHLLFEMKQLRELDRDILRKFLIINDTIEEQKWMMEEKQEAIKRSLSEEGEDPLNFEIASELPEERDDDEESIQSVLSRHNSQTEVFNDNSPQKELDIIRDNINAIEKESDIVSTSSDSALSMSGESSTLSSTTSLPVSNRSSSPPTSNLSTTSASSSYIDTMEAKVKAKEIITTARTEPPQRVEYEDDIEGYYRMHGSSMKRGSYPFPRQSHSFDVGYKRKNHAVDDNTLDSAYSTRRGSTDSDSRDAAEYAMAVRRRIVDRNYAGSFRNDDYHQRPIPRSQSLREQHDPKNRVQRITVQPDMDVSNRIPALRRSSSVAEKSSASYRLLQHPTHQRHLARLNMNKHIQSMSFVPIAEQESDTSTNKAQVYSSDSGVDSVYLRYPYSAAVYRPHPTISVNRSAAGSAASNSSSSSSLTQSSSNSSLHSPTRYTRNEADRYYSRPRIQEEPVWVQRVPDKRHVNDFHGMPHPKPIVTNGYAQNYHGNHGKHNASDVQLDKRRGKSSKRILSTKSTSTAYRENAENRNVLTVSCKPKSTKGSNQAVYKWIQTQDDVTYL